MGASLQQLFWGLCMLKAFAIRQNPGFHRTTPGPRKRLCAGAPEQMELISINACEASPVLRVPAGVQCCLFLGWTRWSLWWYTILLPQALKIFENGLFPNRFTCMGFLFSAKFSVHGTGAWPCFWACNPVSSWRDLVGVSSDIWACRSFGCFVFHLHLHLQLVWVPWGVGS